MIWSLPGFRGIASARRFGEALAVHCAEALAAAAADRSGSKARLMQLSMQAQVKRFVTAEKLHFFSKAAMANEFRWGLADRGVERAKVHELTEWLLLEVSRRQS